MAIINFPSSPTLNQVYSYNGKSWTYNGTGWLITAGNISTTLSVTPPIASSGGAVPTISLAANYGDNQNPYAAKTANYVLAAPNGSAGVPTFRALVPADIAAAGLTTQVQYNNSGTTTGSANFVFDGTNVGIGGLTPIASNGVLQLNSYGSIQTLLEKATITATAPATTTQFDVSTQAVQYYTTPTANNFTLNIRGNSGTALNTIMQIGQSVTIALFVINGTTAYYPTAYTIDGTAVTPKWQGGTAPTSGNASAIDVYAITVVKTASATFTVLASQTKFV